MRSMVNAQMDTEQLVQMAQTGDQGAFTQLHERYKKLVCKVIRRTGIKDYQIREDLCQETFIKVHKNLSKYKLGNFSGWIGTLARHVTLNYLRKSSNKETPLEEANAYSDEVSAKFLNVSYTADPAQQAVTNEGRDILHKCVNQLPKLDKEIWVLRHHERITVKEIAERLNREPQFISERLSSAKKKLRKTLKRGGYRS